MNTEFFQKPRGVHDAVFILPGFASLPEHIEHGTLSDGQLQTITSWARFWSRWVSAIFYKAHLDADGSALFLPSAPSDLQVTTEVLLLLRNAIFDAGYKPNHHPDWMKIALQEIQEQMEPKNSA